MPRHKSSNISSIKLMFLISTLFYLINPFSIDQVFNVCEEGCDMESGWIHGLNEADKSQLSQYFVCGWGFRSMKWEKNLCNCNCQSTFNQGIKCEYCLNSFSTMTNAIKVIFCHYDNWNQQIQKVFETGNKQSGSWRQTKCPRGMYMHKVAARISTQQQNVYVGLNGMQVRCQNIALNQSSIVKDNASTFLSSQSQNQFGNFVSAVKVSYIEGSKITGITYGFEGIPIISRVEIKYSRLEQVNSTTITIQSIQVPNPDALKPFQISIKLSQTYTVRNTFKNENPYSNNFIVSPSVKIQSLTIPDPSASVSSYSKSTTNFKFGGQVSTTIAPKLQFLATVPMCKSQKISSTLQELPVRQSYEALITFENKYTGQQLAKKTVKGIIDGTITSGVKSSVVESSLLNCSVSSPKLTMDELFNSTWKWIDNYNGHTFDFKLKIGGKFAEPAQKSVIDGYIWNFDGEAFNMFYVNGSLYSKFVFNFRDGFGKWHLNGFHNVSRDWYFQIGQIG